MRVRVHVDRPVLSLINLLMLILSGYLTKLTVFLEDLAQNPKLSLYIDFNCCGYLFAHQLLAIMHFSCLTCVKMFVMFD